MNGRFLLDTNAIITLLNGHDGTYQQLQNAVWIGISVISELEFLSFRSISQNDIALFQSFKARIQIINLDSNDTTLTNTIISTRQNFNLKLPDAIIAASAMENQALLLSNDVIFQRVAQLSVLTF